MKKFIGSALSVFSLFFIVLMIVYGVLSSDTWAKFKTKKGVRVSNEFVIKIETYKKTNGKLPESLDLVYFEELLYFDQVIFNRKSVLLSKNKQCSEEDNCKKLIYLQEGEGEFWVHYRHPGGYSCTRLNYQKKFWCINQL